MNALVRCPKKATPATIRMRFGDRDAIRMAGVFYRYVRETDAGTGHILERQDAPGVCVTYDHDTLWKERFEPGFLYLPDHFDEDAVDRPVAVGVDAFPDVPDREKLLIVWKLALCEGLRDLLTTRDGAVGSCASSSQRFSS